MSERGAVGLKALWVGADDVDLAGAHLDVSQQERQHPLADATEPDHQETAAEHMFLD